MTPLSIQALVLATEKAADEFHAGKTIETIQAETALTWAGRALKAYEYFIQTGDIRWLLDAADYGHEALEHAALHPDPAVLDVVRAPLFGAAQAARRHPAFVHFVSGCSAA